MRYPIEFFELQEAFARRVSTVAGIPFEEALLNYTSCYRRIGVANFDFNENHSTWRSFMDRIKDGQSAAQAAYQLSAATPDGVTSTRRFGCMGFDCRDDVVVLHFRNDFSAPEGPLSRRHIPARRLELKQMFECVFQHHKAARIVEGCSWLYNYEAYRGLFPAQFTSNMSIEDAPVRIHSTWGQFIDSSAGLHAERARRFMNSIASASSLPALLAAFPFCTYKPTADISTFYPFYGISRGL